MGWKETADGEAVLVVDEGDVVSTEAALLKRAVITIPAKDWEGFKAWIERPAEAIPTLAKLARRRDFCT